MPSPTNILCLSFRTPPAVRPQSILIGKMVPEWIKQGLKPVVVTYDTNGGRWDIHAPIYTITTPPSIPLVRNIPVLRDIVEYLYMKKTSHAISRIARKHKIDAIFSFANPQISNIIGAMVKKQTGIPFVAHFSDPYADAFFGVNNWIAQTVKNRQEQFVIETSDAVIFVDQNPREMIMKKYPEAWKKKTYIIPHCFDPADYPSSCKNKQDGFTLSYIGTFYEKRNPEILLTVAKRLRDSQQPAGKKFTLQLVGAAQTYGGYSAEKLTGLIRNADLEHIVQIIPPVPYVKSLEYMVCSDCLIVFDANIPNSPFLPSKVIDYAGSGTPIVAITPANSPSDRVVTELGYRSFTYDGLDELTGYIAGMIRGGTRPTVRTDALHAYHVSETTAKLRSIFNTIASV